MKIYVILFFLLFSFISGQSRKDSLYSFFEKNSKITKGKLYKADPEKYRTYLFDLSWTKEFYEYKNLVSKSDINELKRSDNPSLHLIGILIDLNNNNSQENFFEEMNELIDNNKYEFIEISKNEKDFSCLFLEGAIMYFIRNNNNFYKPSFSITKDQRKGLSRRVTLTKSIPFKKLRRDYDNSNH